MNKKWAFRKHGGRSIKNFPDRIQAVAFAKEKLKEGDFLSVHKADGSVDWQETIGGSPTPPPVVNIPRDWEQGDRHEQVVGLGKRKWKIQDLRLAVADCQVFDVPLAFLDLSAHWFDTEGGLIDFAIHMKHVNETDLKYPIIFDQWGKILDGRHRIVKALLLGHTTIKGVKVPDGTGPTYYET